MSLRHACALLAAGLAMPAAAQAPAAAAAAPAAPSPSALASARKLMALMQIDRTVRTMFANLVPLMSQSIVGGLDANATTADIMKAMESKEGGRERILAILNEELTVELDKVTPTLIDRTAQEYATSFSAAELDELVSFYSGGTGGKLITLLPTLQEKMAAFGRMAGGAAGGNAARRGMERAIKELLPKEAGKEGTEQ